MSRFFIVPILLTFVVLTNAAQAQTDVPSNWALVPSGLSNGDSFRLLFLTSGTRNAESSNIGTYNTYVQNAAANGHASIRAYSSGFRVVASTEDDDARDNTSTLHSSSNRGVPIYWLGGNKLADQYQDFYNGNWDDEVNPKDASGNSRPYDNTVHANRPFTGSKHNGIGDDGEELGKSLVREGRLNDSSTVQGPLGSNSTGSRDENRPFYGLSEVFRVEVDAPDRHGPPTTS